AGDHPLVMIDVIGHAVEKSGFAGACPAGNQDIAAHPSYDFKNLAAFRRNGTEMDQLIESKLVFSKLANGKNRPIDRERRSDHIDARAVGKTRVANWRSLVNPAPDLADDTLTNVHQLRVVAKANVGQLNLAADLDEGTGCAIHHDIGDVVAAKQWFERPVAENVIANIVDQIFLFADRHGNVLDRDDLVDDVADFLTRVFRVKTRQLRQIDRLDEGTEDHAFGYVIVIGTVRLRSGGLLRRRRTLNGRETGQFWRHDKTCHCRLTLI